MDDDDNDDHDYNDTDDYDDDDLWWKKGDNGGEVGDQPKETKAGKKHSWNIKGIYK